MTDADGDGYGSDTPRSGVSAGGDCDDADAATSPGATEVCDLADNDCDGVINDGLDSHSSEPNDSQGSAFNLGGVDSSWWPWSGGNADVSGLVLYNASDEDWFEFEVDDLPILQDVNFSITVSGLPSTGTYVLEVENTDEGATLSDSGNGTLSVSWSDQALSFDTYNDWVINVYAQSWMPQACSSSYTLRVSL
ncbi:MAG: putative metal-binding motif-containing protein [Alphaproteobacteria bacterium]|nr:putative metal-binding motif-containing protein [Alphaproteobacteria bacterium]